jgi:hypothetical protein
MESPKIMEERGAAMATERKAMWVVFKMDKQMSSAEWRERFSGAYQVIFDLPGLFFKSWWTNQEKGEWGALYIFDSEKDLREYISSDLWVNKIPEKYGCKPEVTLLDPGPIIAKETLTKAENSWLSD